MARSPLAQHVNEDLNSYLTGSRGSSDTTGQYAAEAEFDPTGVSLGFSDPYVEPRGPIEYPQEDGVFSLLPEDPSGRCRLDGFAMPCAMVLGMRGRGTAVDAPVEEVTTLRFRNQVTVEIRYTLGIWTQTSNGAGYLPAGARFIDGPVWRVGLGGDAVGIGAGVYGGSSQQQGLFSHAQETQEPLRENNPPKIDGPPSKHCNISVSFEEGTFYDGDPRLPNGVGLAPETQIGSVYGLGFTVSGSVSGGGIGNIGRSVNAAYSEGAWAIQQWVSAYTKIDGVEEFTGGSARPDLDDTVRHKVDGNQFSWWDHPGPSPTKTVFPGDRVPITSFYGRYNFIVKAINGNKQCQVKFHVSMDYNAGHWNIGWGKGLY